MPEDDIIIIDNFVSKSFQNEISNFCFSSVIDWFFYKHAGYENDDRDAYMIRMPNNVVDTFQFVHQIINHGKILSKHHLFFEPILKSLPFQKVGITRAKLNLTTNVNIFSEQNIGAPHTDYAEDYTGKYFTAIYYVNDSDGDTIIFNERKIQKNLTIKKRITPKRGRMLIFNGHYLHSPSNPIETDLRCVLNINFITG